MTYHQDHLKQSERIYVSIHLTESAYFFLSIKILVCAWICVCGICVCVCSVGMYTCCTHAVVFVRVLSLCRRETGSTPISSTTILHYWWVMFSLNLELTSLDRLGPCKPLGLAWLCLPKAGAGLFMGRYVWLCIQIMRIWTQIFILSQKDYTHWAISPLQEVSYSWQFRK